MLISYKNHCYYYNNLLIIKKKQLHIYYHSNMESYLKVRVLYNHLYFTFPRQLNAAEIPMFTGFNMWCNSAVIQFCNRFGSQDAWLRAVPLQAQICCPHLDMSRSGRSSPDRERQAETPRCKERNFAHRWTSVCNLRVDRDSTPGERSVRKTKQNPKAAFIMRGCVFLSPPLQNSKRYSRSDPVSSSCCGVAFFFFFFLFFSEPPHRLHPAQGDGGEREGEEKSSKKKKIRIILRRQVSRVRERSWNKVWPGGKSSPLRSQNGGAFHSTLKEWKLHVPFAVFFLLNASCS